ncbi:thialysine N-epsilon-acetyltransferase-like isoform X2 [Plodia interpunctella]|uniref:thialysine N-epsilon-acetyltransferase-like isoform X2 n=1 Tax=Plodia interpunctella TaxID=58824 RepID=UPI002367F0BD|nr:thialysine N-epsilon-acetyltransferase-like [Plodia interpunctella]
MMGQDGSTSHLDHEKYVDDDVMIRNAVKQDMASVNEMIHELAHFLERPDGPQLSLTDLEMDGFGSSPPAFFCKIAQSISNGRLLGYALYFPTYSPWEGRAVMLEDLYVRPSESKTDVGKKLFNSVARTAIDMGSNRLDLHLLQWNPECIYFHQQGAVNLKKSEDWCYYRLPLYGDIIEEILEDS